MLNKYLRSFLFVFFCLLVFLTSFIITSFITYQKTINNLPQKGFTETKDFRISNSLYDDIQSYIKPFSSIDDVEFDINKQTTVEYGLQGFVNCYINTNNNSNDKLAITLKKLSKRPYTIDWSLVQVKNSGYYIGDNCFAFYINPDSALTIESLDEVAVFAEMYIRQSVGDKIVTKAKYNPSKNTSAISFSESSVYNNWDNNVFGLYDPNEQKIYVNTDSDSSKKDIGWRLIHEMNHSFVSNPLRVRSPSFYAIPEELLTEFASTYIANSSSEKDVSYGPAIRAILKYIDEEELLDIYYNGDINHLKNIVDSKTYPGALCTYLYYVAQNDAYGWVESNLYEKAFIENDPTIPEEYINCVIKDGPY